MKSLVSGCLVLVALASFTSSANAQGGGSIIGIISNANIASHSGSPFSGYQADANLYRHSNIDPSSAIIYGVARFANAGAYSQYGNQRFGGQYYPNRNSHRGARYSQPQGYVNSNFNGFPQIQNGYPSSVVNPAQSFGPSNAAIYGGNNEAAHLHAKAEVDNFYRNMGHQDGVGGFIPSMQSAPNIAPR